MLAACEVEERTCTLDDVGRAEEAFIASTVREVMPIAAVGEIELPAAPGPVTRSAHEAFRALLGRELPPADRFT
jgi:branched-chain amino acid aminotransferase